MSYMQQDKGLNVSSPYFDIEPIKPGVLDRPREVGMAVLGCGYWGMNYLRLCSEIPDARLVVACDLRRDRLHEIERRFPGVRTTTNIEQALAIDEVDAAIVCTQATTHYDVARLCLMTNKHVLVEKPITSTVDQAAELQEVAEKTGLVLMVGHTFIYNAGIRKVKECIDRNRAGRVYYIHSSRTNLGPIRRDVNALWDLASHDVSIFNYLLGGTPEWVSAVGVRALRNEREDAGFVSLGYKRGIVGHIQVSWIDPSKVRELVVIGSKRRIAFNDLDPLEQVRIFKKSVASSRREPASFGEYQLQIRDGDIISPRIEVSEPLKNQYRHFLECITQGVKPLTGGREGLAVVCVMEAIDRSVSRNGATVKVLEPRSRSGSVRGVVRASSLSTVR